MFKGKILKIKWLTAAFISIVCGITYTALANNVKSLPRWQTYEMQGQPSLRGSAIIGQSMWVTGSNNGVFVSQDMGKTWENKSIKSPVITDFRDIELFDKNTAIVMGVGSGEQSMLYKTIDGGDSWHLLYKNQDAEGFFDSIAFWDKQTGLLLGDPVDGYYVVKKTQDGGKTWRRIEQKKLPKILEKEAAFAASGNTLIVGDNGKAWLTTGGFSASVYTSEDFGESWQRHSVPLFQQTQTAGGYGLGLNHLQQPFVLGGDYQQRPAKYPNIATFVNEQWLSVDAGERGLRTAMACQHSVCIATGKTNSDISFDAGQTWQLLPFEKFNKEVSNDPKVEAQKNDQGFYTLAADDGVFIGAGINGKVGVLSLK